MAASCNAGRRAMSFRSTRPVGNEKIRMLTYPGINPACFFGGIDWRVGLPRTSQLDPIQSGPRKAVVHARSRAQRLPSSYTVFRAVQLGFVPCALHALSFVDEWPASHCLNCLTWWDKTSTDVSVLQP
jgi:hypothetical protein